MESKGQAVCGTFPSLPLVLPSSPFSLTEKQIENCTRSVILAIGDGDRGLRQGGYKLKDCLGERASSKSDWTIDWGTYS